MRTQAKDAISAKLISDSKSSFILILAYFLVSFFIIKCHCIAHVIQAFQYHFEMVDKTNEKDYLNDNDSREKDSESSHFDFSIL